METTDIVIDQRQVPPGYVYCFNSACVKHTECLRWIAGEQIDQKLTTGRGEEQGRVSAAQQHKGILGRQRHLLALQAGAAPALACTAGAYHRTVP